MKTFKVKDLVITLESGKTAFTPKTPFVLCLMGCTNKLVSRIDCKIFHSGETLLCKYTALDRWRTCPGTVVCGGSIDPTWQLEKVTEVELLEEVRAIKAELVEYEALLEASIKPTQREDIIALSNKIAEVLKDAKG